MDERDAGGVASFSKRSLPSSPRASTVPMQVATWASRSVNTLSAMSSTPTRTGRDLQVAAAAVIGFLIYVWLLTQATVPFITMLAFASDTRTNLYAALLALLVAAPGCLLTLPRAFTPPPPRVVPSVSGRRQLSARRRSFVKTDVIGMALLLLAQVPLPAPWWRAGKAATIANITKSAEIVEISARFATWSLVIFAIGFLAAGVVRVYHHALGLRIIGAAIAILTPVVAWAMLVQSP